MQIEKLYIYPIKSCGGISVQSLNLLNIGPEFDRMLVIVDENGKFLSQRTNPQMCLIRTSITDLGRDGKILNIEAPDMGKIFVPLSGEPLTGLGKARECEVTIHKDTCGGIDLGDYHASYMSQFLGQKCRLVQQVSRLPRIRMASSLNREIQVSYADGYPLLVTTEESLAHLNQQIEMNGGSSLPMDRFRPNIVFSGGTAYEEDGWKMLKVGRNEALLEGANACVRCVITTVDQMTAERGKEPLKTLAQFRNFGKGVQFGRNFAISKHAEIFVGDAAEATQ